MVIYQKTRSGTLKMNILLVTTNILEYCYQVDWNGLCVVKLLRTRSEKAINMIKHCMTKLGSGDINFGFRLFRFHGCPRLYYIYGAEIWGTDKVKGHWNCSKQIL